MIGLAPAPNPLVHNHVHPPPFFLVGRKTKPYPQPLTPSLTTLDLFIFQMACGAPKFVLGVLATVTGRSAQLMVAEPTHHAHPSKELLMAAAQASKIASTLFTAYWRGVKRVLPLLVLVLHVLLRRRFSAISRRFVRRRQPCPILINRHLLLLGGALGEGLTENAFYPSVSLGLVLASAVRTLPCSDDSKNQQQT